MHSDAQEKEWQDELVSSLRYGAKVSKSSEEWPRTRKR